MVLGEKLAGRAEATDLFHVLGTGRSTGTEKLFGLIPMQVMFLVVLAYRAVFPAERFVLFIIRYNRGFG
jgi:hypothetical protein